MGDDTRRTDDNAWGNDGRFRNVLAWFVTIAVFLFIGLFGSFALLRTVDDEQFGRAKDLLAILLPVLSTWGGTVLAFYFTKENYESAARIARQVTPEERLRSISIKDAAIPVDQAITLSLDKSENETKLKDDMIDGKLTPNKKERLPILDDKGRVKYIAHRSLIDRFIADKAMSEPGAVDLCNLTLADMLENPEYKAMLTGFGILRPTATLAEAKMLMDTVPNCSDVFTTEDGTAASKAIGWVTNVIVREKATV